MLKLKKIAVTGGLGCGKSTVCQILRDLGAYVIDSDEIVHKQLEENELLKNKVIDLLGTSVVIKGRLNRKKIAEKVFQNPKLLTDFETIIHPIIFAEIDSHYEKAAKDNKHPFFVVEIPLLYETKTEEKFDYTIVVTADEEKCIERSHFSKEEIERRMSRQMKLVEKAKKAHFLIENNGNKAELENQVKQLYKQLLQI